MSTNFGVVWSSLFLLQNGPWTHRQIDKLQTGKHANTYEYTHTQGHGHP